MLFWFSFVLKPSGNIIYKRINKKTKTKKQKVYNTHWIGIKPKFKEKHVEEKLGKNCWLHFLYSLNVKYAL